MGEGVITVVYYTSNREDEAFEAEIRRRLIVSVDDRWPIISVSQKPIDLGKNICVGEMDANDANAIRQIQIGVEAATTPFAIAAESDCLYPPDYFDWIPPEAESCYRYPNLWIMSKWYGVKFGSGFRYKFGAECAQIVGRDYWLRAISASMQGMPQWSAGNDVTPPLVFGAFRLWRGDFKRAVVNIKTTEGMRKWTHTVGRCLPEDRLPYWGSAEDLRKALWG